jgi:competence protein ComEC
MRVPLILLALCLASALTAQARGQAGPAYCAPPDSLGARLTFFDVGQGDAALLEGGDGRFVLVDGGPNASAVARLLEQRGVSSLALVVASHNHLDHIGGLPLVLRRWPVTAFMENGLAAPTAVYRRLNFAVAASGVTVLQPARQELRFGTTVIRVLIAPTDLYTQNERSIGLLVSHGAFRALLTGDAEIRALEAWLRDDAIPRVTVVKAGHHGSANATTVEWVQAAAPTLVVIPVGARNRYGHPSPQVLEWWAAPGREILRTDLHGTIDVRGCGDGTIRVRSERQR